jgi:hypothetical protein
MARYGGLVLILLFVGILLGGCGGGGGESYGDVLQGLERAAATGEPYDAVSRAEGLKPVQRTSVEAFCETTHVLLLNGEAWKVRVGPYLVSRIKTLAERQLPFVSTGPVNTAVNRYRDLFGLDSFEPADVRRYMKACYK